MNKFLLFVLIAVGFSCSDKARYENISGEWTCVSWLNKQTNVDKCNHNVYFKFNLDKTYQSKIGIISDKGTYVLAEDRLFTTPEGKMEIGVQVLKLNKDSLQLLMNNGGVEEILTLVKK